ncbi:hypothetical protein HTVC309P_gp42 [Pelagibacter phage HTVC309P]|nr:hypothetical protein HTVC309P_gp42 [Pelagibacter phage HTVC309P]
MKFILAFSICSAITGYCNNTATLPKEYNSWTECVNGGAKITTTFTKKYETKMNEEKLYVRYFCNEIKKETT